MNVKSSFCLLALFSATAASSARAQTAPGEDWLTPPNRVDRREVMTRFEMGYRGSFAPDSGFDPFSTNDLLPEFSMLASRTVFAVGRFSFAPGFAWDHGGAGATARGDTTALTINRLAVPLEGRVHFGRWGYAFARVAPGLAALHAEVDEPSAPAPLSKTQWLFATDLSAGYAWLAWPRFQASEMVARLWLQSDVGYGWVAQERLNLGPDLPSGSAQRVDGVDLGPISMSGAFFRVAAAVSF